MINATNKVGTYWIQVRALGVCGITRVHQHAVLRYDGGPERPPSKKPTYDDGEPKGKVCRF